MEFKIILILVCLQAIYVHSKNINRIIGGKEVDISSFPYQLSLQYKTEHNCGASIISPIYAITASHCVHGIKPTSLLIRAGSTIMEQGGTEIALKQVFKHPKYDSSTYDNDIAILELASPLKYSSKIQPIGLPSLNETVKVGQEVYVSGWGDTKENGEPSTILKAVSINVIGQNECKKYFKEGEITTGMFCAGALEGGKDACQGDSGGPLVVKSNESNLLVGIVSWGDGCARPNHPTVYTYVSKYRDFIRAITNI